MNAKSEDLDLKAVADALEVLVLAYYEERHKPKPENSNPRFQSLADVPLMSREEAYRERIVRSPLTGALRLGIREIGLHIWSKTGSSDKMQEALYDTVNRHPGKEQELIDVIDKAWDGIGNCWWA